MSAFMCSAPSGAIVYLPNGQQSKIAGYGDTVESARVSAQNNIFQTMNLNPIPAAAASAVLASLLRSMVPRLRNRSLRVLP